MARWAEIKADFDEKDGCELVDDIVNCLNVDAWLTDEDDESGNVIAKVIKTKSGDVGVVYIDTIAIHDDYAQSIIKEAIDELKG